MKTVVVLAGLLALTVAGTVPQHPAVKTKDVDTQFIQKQKQVLSLVQNLSSQDHGAEYYKIGLDYNIEANIDNYTNKKAVEEFLVLMRSGFLPKYQTFSIYYDKMREEAITLFHVLYYAKDFETFYKTAAYARVHFNMGQFVYSYYIAVIQRKDTEGIILPPAYELFPYSYVNSEALNKLFRVKMQNGLIDPAVAKQVGVVKENDNYVIYTNYSNSMTYSYNEERISYFTEDIGINSYYFYFHTFLPYWLNGDEFGALKQYRGEIFYYFYQQLLARYYLERLTNGLGEIPQFSWEKPIRMGYTPLMFYTSPMPQRNNYYIINPEEYELELQYLESYEQAFLQYVDSGHVKAYGQDVDLRNSKAINFVGNYWQSNADLYGKMPYSDYDRTYQHVARRLLGAATEPVDKYHVNPSALEMYQTSLRDPMFYQLYAKILDYCIQYKENLKPYTQDELHYVGVKIEDVKVEKLITYFDMFSFDASNSMYLNPEEVKTNYDHMIIRQPRLNHKPFTVSIDLKSDVETDAVVKIFLGPEYDSNGHPMSLENNWMNFIELDWFVHKLTRGKNTIQRNSKDFFLYKEDSVSTTEILSMLDQGKAPLSMSEKADYIPNRMMLPKGTKGGYPLKMFVIIYPHRPLTADLEPFKTLLPDNSPLGYPFDRPVHSQAYFKQPNMFIEEVLVYHEGPQYPHMLNVPGYTPNYTS